MKITKKQIGTGIALVLAMCLFLRYFTNIITGVGYLLAAASTLIVGFIIAYVLNIAMNFYERKLLKGMKGEKLQKYKRVISILLAIATIVMIVVLLMRLVVPELKNCIVILVAGIPGLLEDLQKLVASNPQLAEIVPSALLEDSWQQQIDLTAVMDQVVTWAKSGASNVVLNYVSGILSGIVTFVMGLFFALYILGSKEILKRQCNHVLDTYMKPAHKERMLYVLSTFNDSFHSFIVGQCMEAVIIGSLCILGMLILRFPYAVMIGALVGCTALIPIAGAYIGAIVGAIMILTVSPVKALLFLVFILVLQQLEGQLIYPKVVGTSIGLPGIWVFAIVIFGGALCGIPGILFGIPIAAGCYHLLADDIHKRDEAARIAKQEKSRKA